MTAARLGIIVFARMSSHRLPGKVLMDFGGRPLLAHILMRAAVLDQPLIVATSRQPEDDAVAELAIECGAAAFRGSLDDVLQRAVDCADVHGLDAFARLCGDRPYFPQDQMRDALTAMADSLAHGKVADLLTNHLPVNPPPGLSTEVVRTDALRRALADHATPHHREHLTAYLYENHEQFVINAVAANFDGARGHRFAVDFDEDYQKLGAAAQQLDDVNAGFETVAALLDAPVQSSRSVGTTFAPSAPVPSESAQSASTHG